MYDLSIVLAALYLRGAPRAVELRRAAWPEVLRSLRKQACSPDKASEALREAGFWAEALVLEGDGLLDWAREQFDLGSVLTAVDNEYPCRWVRVLGTGAPPALWRLGAVSASPSLSIVGSRDIPNSVGQFCHRVGREASRLGFSVVSGRAEGCDRAAAGGARAAGGDVIEILPHGIALTRTPVAGCLLSVCAPEEPFSAATAMERNALIYAASSHTVIGHSRFKEGGTWTGAIHASRARLSSLIVRRSPDIAMRSLVALGGAWLDSPAGLASAIKTQRPQRELFEQAI